VVDTVSDREEFSAGEVLSGSLNRLDSWLTCWATLQPKPGLWAQALAGKASEQAHRTPHNARRFFKGMGNPFSGGGEG
jgi:hypothetical protein